MNCEEAKQIVTTGTKLSRRLQAHRHVRQCPDCTEWFAGVRKADGYLETIPPHELPDGLQHWLQGIVKTGIPFRGDRRKVTNRKGTNMKRLIFGAVGLVVLAVIVAAANSVWGPGTSSVAWADVKQALSDMNVVHMKGESFCLTGENKTRPLAVHKDKWIRREPLAVYEEVTPVQSQLPEAASLRYVFAGNTEQVYFYFPQKDNKAIVSRGLSSDFMKEVLGPFGQAVYSGEDPEYKTIGNSKINDRDVILLERQDGQFRNELAVDAQTKLTLRVRQFIPGPDGDEIEVTNLSFEYNQSPPPGIFDWQPPAGATIVDKRRR